MEPRLAYCSTCGREVRVALTAGPLHEGHANIPDGPELVCLDLEERCCGGECALSHEPSQVMAVRLARSGLREEPWPTTHLLCEGCDAVQEMEVLDDSTARCTVCGTLNAWIMAELMDHGWAEVPPTAAEA